MKNKFWCAMQKVFGIVNDRDHRRDVPVIIRESSHEQNNETLRLKAQIKSLDRRDDVLRELVSRMQQTLSHRSH